MKITEEAIEAALKAIGPDLAAGVGNDEDQRKIIGDALNAAAPFMNRMITAPDERDAVPQSAIVRSTGGTIVCRFDDMWGGVFGRTETFLWNDLELPITVLWEPGG